MKTIDNQGLNVLFKTSGNALIEVIVWIAFVFLIIEIIFFFWKDHLISGIKNSKNFQVPIAGFLGLVPGCGGTFFLMPLYKERLISFGSMSAAFITTIGEVSFLLISINPISFLLIAGISFIVSVIVGYFLEFFKFAPPENKTVNLKNRTESEETLITNNFNIVNTGEDSTIKPKRKKPRQKSYLEFFDKKFFPIILALIIIIVFPLTIIESFIPKDLYQDNQKINNYFKVGNWLGVITLFIFVPYKIFRDLYIKSHPEYKDQDEHHHNEKENEEEQLQTKSRTEFIDEMHHLFITLLFLIFWIFISFLIISYTFVLLDLNTSGNQFNLYDNYGLLLLIMLIAIIVAIIPTCGPQVAFATLFLSNIISFSGLITNNIAQDGHAGITMINLDKKSYLYLKIINIAAAIVVGFIFINIEFFTNFDIWISSFNNF